MARSRRPPSWASSSRSCSASVPLPELDRIPVRVADFGAGIVGSLDRPPGAIDALRPERGERVIHVLHLQREALPAETLLAGACRDRSGFGIAHDLDRGAAELEVDEIERTRRGRHA